jgi:perosamine synthetase
MDRYCGRLGLSPLALLRREMPGNVFEWYSSRACYYTHKGRTAIRRACDLLGLGPGDEILVPSYNCGSEIDALFKSSCSIGIYRIDKAAAVDMHDLKGKLTNKTKAIYVTHYFGFSPDIENIRQLCDEKGLSLIEDCALSLFSSHNSRKLGTFGEVAILSFPKTLPVPDGGALIINDPGLALKTWGLRRPKMQSIVKRLLPLGKAMALRYLSRWGAHTLMDNVAPWSAAKQARIIDDDIQTMPDSYFYDKTISDTAISSLTRRLLGTFSPEDIIQRRRANYFSFLAALKDSDKVVPLYRELPTGVCPLSFPVIVPERNRAYAKMSKEFISVIPWWAGYHPNFPWSEFPDACFLKDNLLALPVHQQLNREDILFIVDRLLSHIRHQTPVW